MHSWQVWFKGLIAACIGGAGSYVAGIALTNDWKLVSKLALINAITSGGAYLKQSPLPTDTVTVTNTTTKTVDVTKE